MLGNVRVDVVSIIKVWIEEPQKDGARKRFFKVNGSDGFTYTIYYDEVLSEWFLKAA